MIKKRTARLAAFFVTAGLLALAPTGCGFRPLHGTAGNSASMESDASVARNMAYIRITPIADRTGQILRNALIQRINPRGEPPRPRWVLDITLSESSSAIILERDESTARTKLSLRARFQLRSLDRNNAVIMEGNETGTSAFTSEGTGAYAFSDADGKDQAREKAAILLSESLTRRIGLFFRSNSGGAR